MLNYSVDKYRLDVFNRWGQLMFSTTDLREGWSGLYHQQPQPSGTYVWEIIYRDDQASNYIHKKGIVLLIR
jgi:gliding motility-associated-like protein